MAGVGTDTGLGLIAFSSGSPTSQLIAECVSYCSLDWELTWPWLLQIWQGWVSSPSHRPAMLARGACELGFPCLDSSSALFTTRSCLFQQISMYISSLPRAAAFCDCAQPAIAGSKSRMPTAGTFLPVKLRMTLHTPTQLLPTPAASRCVPVRGVGNQCSKVSGAQRLLAAVRMLRRSSKKQSHAGAVLARF